MIKVLILNDQLTRGGKERRIAELVKYCRDHYNIIFEIVVIHDKIEYEDILATGYKVHALKWAEHKALDNMKRLVAITKAFNPDLIHSWSSMTDVIGVFLKFYTRKKLISSMIARVIPYRTLRDKDYLRALYTFPFMDFITSNTKAGIERYHAPKSRSLCIYNGFNFERSKNLHRAESLIRQHKLENKFVVGMVAAFAERKDQETFINAALSLLEKMPGKFAFILVGYGPYEQARIGQSGKHFQDDIIFTGMCSFVEEYINIFDIGVLCTNSAFHGEGISNSILEYMAMAKPVIATDGMGTREIVDDTVTGFLVQPKLPQLVEDKILYIMNHPEEARQMGLNGQQKVREHFSISAMCSSFIKIYEKLIKKPVPEITVKQQYAEAGTAAAGGLL
jgi:glycosyltransferase involved in cell wall biosynthesis